MNRRMMISAIAAGVLAFAMGRAMACTADVGKATTDCYVRSIEDGDVIGALYKGDIVVVTGNAKNGYKKIEISGKTYKVYGEYLKIKEDVCLDEVKVSDRVRKSRDKQSGIYGKTKHSIKGSVFEGINPF